MIAINKKSAKCLIILIVFVSILASCGKDTTTNKNKNVDIYNVVKESFLTDKGYSDELSKHMSEEVFRKTNIYNTYPINNAELKKSYKVDFNLKEDSQSVKKDLIYVNMTYSAIITDLHGNCVCGSSNIPITFTVRKTGNEWYIIDKHESA